jgi:hypothetical protein
MNKKNYEAPLIETEMFLEDIVTTSIPDEVDGVKGFHSWWLD